MANVDAFVRVSEEWYLDSVIQRLYGVMGKNLYASINIFHVGFKGMEEYIVTNIYRYIHMYMYI